MLGTAGKYELLIGDTFYIWMQIIVLYSEARIYSAEFGPLYPTKKNGYEIFFVKLLLPFCNQDTISYIKIQFFFLHMDFKQHLLERRT